MAVRVMILAGGTGGHVFPALAVAEKLRAQGHQVTWMGTRHGIEARVIPAANIDIDWLDVSGVRGKGLLRLFSLPWMLMKSCWQASKIMRKRNPQVVLGMGGFVAGPGGLMARRLKIPLVIHEQNRVPGTTNRLLMKLATVVLEAFPGSFDAEVNARATGNPLREVFEQAVADTDNNDEHKAAHILVLGGSLGAAALNEAVPAALSALPESIRFEVVHQSGKRTLEIAEQQYREHQVGAKIQDFIEDMVAVYQWADVVICRAGAMTISELAATGSAAILVPLPSAIDDHQTRNAEYLSKSGAAVLMPQSELNAESLAELLEALLADSSRLASMRQAAFQLARLDATQTVADACLEVAA